MRKGQKLSKATPFAQQLQVRKSMKEYEKRERQKIRENSKSRKTLNSNRKRPAKSYSNKYTCTPEEPDIFDKILDGIWDLIFKSFKKIFRIFFR